MLNCVDRAHLGLVVALWMLWVARVDATESYFGTTDPPVVAETAEPKKSVSTPTPGVNQSMILPAMIAAPTLKSAAPVQTARSAEETKLDDALGTPDGFNGELEGRFRRLLAAPPLKTGGEHLSYEQDLDRVRALLQERKTTEAWQALQETADFYGSLDADASRELAVWVKSALDLNKALNQLDGKTEQIRTVEVHAAGLATLLKEPPVPTATAKPGAPVGAKPAPPPRPADWTVVTDQADLERKMELRLKELEAAEARRNLDHSKSTLQESLTQADQNFAGFVSGLCVGGKFQQAMLARSFYEQIFHANCPTEAAMTIVEAEARERQVNALVQLALTKWRAHRIEAATEDLRKAFANSPCQSGLVDLDKGAQRAVATFVEAADKIRQDVKRHRFNEIAAKIEAIQQSAPDFDPAKLLALIHADQLESGFHVDRANQAWQAKRLESARGEWWCAQKTWSDNPVLNDFPEVVRSTWDARKRATEFDQLNAGKNYRQISDQRQLFVDQLIGDTARLARLQQITESIDLLDLALVKIENTRSAGDIDGAWELAEAAARTWPDDPQTGEWLVNLTKEGAEYAKVIERARDAEAKEEFGYSLNWYAVARQLYPRSKLADEASLRLRGRLFPAGERPRFVLTNAHEEP